MVVNSEPLSPEQASELLETFPSLDLIVYYGLTEASRSTFLRPRREPLEKFRTVGHAAPRVEIQTCDTDGRPTMTAAEGEVCIRGPHLAQGYWNRPSEQTAAFRDGWLCTGDLGIIDRDGYLTITGRLKDQINVGGLKVSAAEIEKVIRQHPAVADVAVTGVEDPDGLRGECVAAAIVARWTGLELREIAEYCAQRLEAAAQPQQLMLLDAIPRAETGKVLKGELRRLFEARK
jgi:acyl-CoA synthetase (AMP-forming)/AMP-acid ligase II